MRRLFAVILAGTLLAACAADTGESAPPPPPPPKIDDPASGAGDTPERADDEEGIGLGESGTIGRGSGSSSGASDDAGLGTLPPPGPSRPSRGPASEPEVVIMPEPMIIEEIPIEEPEACRVDGMNDFDWPPAEPSTKVTIPRALLLAGMTAEAQTLGEVGERLENALIEAGYVEYGYQSIGCSGFAMVTRLERIDENGRPLEGAMRFAPPETRPNWSLGGYLSRLFYAPPGYYRQIVFAATDQPYERDDLAPPPTREELDEMLERADVTALPEAMLDRPFTRAHKLHALIYEFEKGEADRDVRQVARLAGAAHVRAAGIYSGLGDDE